MKRRQRRKIEKRRYERNKAYIEDILRRHLGKGLIQMTNDSITCEMLAKMRQTWLESINLDQYFVVPISKEQLDKRMG